MWRHYVYIHKKKSNGEVFYVGKGTANKKDFFSRAKSSDKRNSYWKNIVSKHGFYFEIVAHFVDDKASQKFEKQLIKHYGRRNLKTGCLVNMTDGGDGHCGIIVTAEQRKIRSINAQGKRSEAWIKSIRRARKNGGNGGVVVKGDKLPEWWRERISKSVMGENNAMYGRTGVRHPTARQIVDIETQTVYPSISAAAEMNGFNMKTLYNMLSGHRKNKTNLRFMDGL